MNDIAIQTEHLSKRYEDLWGVRDLNLEIRRGELFAFLGPNGAGKTTTIKMLVGLLRPTEGVARIGGFDIQQNPVEAKALIGYIPDHPYLYEKLSGRDFFHFVGDLFHLDRSLQEKKKQVYFDLFGLTPVQDKLIENYSHGMRQKLVIAASLLHDPAVIIVDEPMVGLDPQSARKVKDLFRGQTRSGNTVFLSTHTLSVAEELADRIGIIHHGKLIFIGTLMELRAFMRREGDLEDLFLELTAEEGI
ncbi:MAG: ABC transporter ATP-binding protein [Candidatus Sumerlaeia bacterium]|nr:ABC transporter ATP-binding protein [Candidatus Sumerlaeia bacterium]